MIEFVYKKQGDGRDSWCVKEFKDGELINAFMIYVSPIEYVKSLLIDAFDAKFKEYWSAKGYSDFDDLNSHIANKQSPYHFEALSLIQWSHRQWEVAIYELDEQSNIDEIINNLEPYG